LDSVVPEISYLVIGLSIETRFNQKGFKMKSIIRKVIGLVFTVVILLTTLQCSAKIAPNLPKDILGISIGMSKADAQQRLEEIATFESGGRKVGQLWKLKNDPHFSSIAVDYDKENRVRFITAFVEKTTAKEKIKFTEVGDLTKAKAEIVEPHHRYVWEVPAEGDKPAYVVNVYGVDAEFVENYSLAKIN